MLGGERSPRNSGMLSVTWRERLESGSSLATMDTSTSTDKFEEISNLSAGLEVGCDGNNVNHGHEDEDDSGRHAAVDV